MNKKGFTLIELLATIVLLAMIAMIAIPAVNSILQNNKEKKCERLKDSIIEAAKLYISDNKYKLSWNNNKETVTLSMLYASNMSSNMQYLNSKVKNPCDDSTYYDDTTNPNIKVVFKNDHGNITIDSKNTTILSDFSCCKEEG